MKSMDKIMRGRYHLKGVTPKGRKVYAHHSKLNRIFVTWQQEDKHYIIKMNCSDEHHKLLNFTGEEMGILTKEMGKLVFIKKGDINERNVK